MHMASTGQHGPRSISGALEAVVCMGLGLRDGLRPRLALMSVLIWLGSVLLWGVAFFLGHDALSARLGEGLGPYLGGVPWLLGLLQFLITFTLFALACMVTARVILEFVLMGRIQRQCLRHYPQLQPGVHNAWVPALRDSLGSTGTLVAGGAAGLTLPLVGGPLALLVGSYVNARSLVNEALEGVATDAECRQVILSSRLSLTLVGLFSTVWMMLPLAGLLGPGVMGAAVCHLSMRQALRLRSAATQA